MDYGAQLLYVGKKGTFQHSSFLAGGATVAAWDLLFKMVFLRLFGLGPCLIAIFNFSIVDHIKILIEVFTVLWVYS